MRGKIVNLCIGFMNLLFGALIIAFTLVVPQDPTLLTVQESFVVGYIVKGIYLVLLSIVFIDALQCYNLRTDTTFNTAYFLGIFSLSFFFIKEPIIGAFNIISGLVVLYKSIKENLVEIDSTSAISVSIVIMAITGILGVLSFTYGSIGESIKNKENEHELSYKEDYFKYITELDITEPYINVKKDGKYGYINPKGEVVLDFEYDYASPFIEITAYDKKFYVALVCEEGSSYIILKNRRPVLSYRSESDDDNLFAKNEELKNIYTNVLKQEGEIKYEIPKITDNIRRAPRVQDDSLPDGSFRYDYNDEYDFIVNQSKLGFDDEYEFAEKDNIDLRIKLETTKVDYDEESLYLFSNGNIPYYELERKTQGWFTSYGSKNPMIGKAQILDFFGDKLLLRNYNNNLNYFIDSTGQTVSEEYKDIYVCAKQERYIVRNQDDSFKIIDKEFNNVFDRQYSSINPRLIDAYIYLTLDTTSDIDFNEYGYADNMSWDLMNYDGDVLIEDVEQVYDLYYRLPTKGSKDEKYTIFINDLIDLEYNFVGDKFYKDEK